MASCQPTKEPHRRKLATCLSIFTTIFILVYLTPKSAPPETPLMVVPRTKRDINASDFLINSTLYDNDDGEECNTFECLMHSLTEEELLAAIRNDIFTPSPAEWVLIGAHSVAFFVGIVGNALVCLAVYRNHTMRTVTNYFIVNLAVADFMVILFCLPPTLVWDVTGTWFFGSILCKTVLYVQNVSVTISVLTLTFISIDRWYAICHPLKFKSTTSRAKKAILLIWFVALTTDVPELVVLTTKKWDKIPNITEIYYTQCDAEWSHRTDVIWNISKIVILYVIPLFFMTFAYFQIVKVLWITDHVLQNEASNNSLPHHRPIPDLCSNGSNRRNTFVMNTNTTTEVQLRSRRKAAKMLVAVVVMFTVCCLPVHMINICRILIELQPTRINEAIILISHWLLYANSALNPVIYNFMSGKFRKEFHATFSCWCWGNRARYNRRRQPVVTRSSTYICRFTTGCGGGSVHGRTEAIPLSTVQNAGNHHSHHHHHIHRQSSIAKQNMSSTN